jgi:superfamily II DNA or RNA helicase
MQWRRKKKKGRGRRAAPANLSAASPPPEEQSHPQGAGNNGRPEKQVEAKKLSRLHKPEGMSLEDWQIELRRQFGREQKFRVKNVGEHPIFSEFEVHNPQSQSTYRVHVRGGGLGDNHCSCPDFATNALGTCKHIEFVLASLSRKRGGAAALRAGFTPPFSEVFLEYGARRQVRFRPGEECPDKVRSVARQFFDYAGVLRPEGFATFEKFLHEAGQTNHDLRCHDDVLSFVAEVRDAERRRAVLDEAFPIGVRSPALKDLLKLSLYEYQREGALFAARAGRALLGDEMGLGKTIQGIAVAELLARYFAVERVLVVCPTSLKHQWHREIERCSHRSAVVVGGLRMQRQAIYAADSFFKIVNYDTVYRDLDLIGHWGPELVILDEAQRIKNWATRTARSVKKIASPYALVLTGTPLENRLEELISIVQFVDRFRLGPTFRLLHEHQVRDPVGKVVGYQDLDRLGRTLEPILLRRHKDEVLDQLPERIDNTVFVPMTELQQRYHSEHREIVARLVEKWRRLRFVTEADQRRLMISLQFMRMSCDSSYLVDKKTDHGKKADEAVMLLDELFETDGVKAVVFSQWLRMHELLVRRLKGKPFDHVLFHGSVPSSKRKGLIDRFRDDPNCRLFLSTDAGGVGLNLQHASVVLNMDLPWNPAVLEQRIGRVHRLGQRQPVRVINFVAQGTIEQGMLEVLRFKKSLFAGVLDGGEKDVFLGGSRLTKFMETVESATAAIPEAMLEDAEEALRTPQEQGEEGRPDRQTGRRRSRPAAGGATRPAPVADVEAEEEAAAPATAAVDPWSALAQVGMALLQQFVSGARPAASPSSGAKATPTTRSMVGRDEQTGEAYLKVPLPAPEVLDQALEAVSALLQNLRR